MFVVTVIYEIKPQNREGFREAILKNAASSLRHEPGCRQFDVSFSEDGLKCFLYEKYADSESFAAHRASPHFNEYAAAIKDWFVDKTIQTYH
ncbi:MAG: antibiotic biosynthesis monooxygenase, partial [Ignavibacteriaceae bacterium]|nr:antibiotic biosynthesis monooxygenase [Ignavibacteriaceae bacterium]